MQIRRALNFALQDPGWARKFGVAVLLGLAPAAMLLFNGWVLRHRLPTGEPLWSFLVAAAVGLASVPLLGFDFRITRQVVAGVDLPLPQWSDFASIARDGLKLWTVVYLWELPATLAQLVAGALSSSAGDEAPLALRGLALVAQLAVLVARPAAEARVAATGSLAAGLDVRAVFAIVRRNLGGYLLLLLVVVVGGAVWLGLSFGVVWLAWSAGGGQPALRDVAVVGPPFALVAFPYSRWVIAHLYGQAYGRAERAPNHLRSRPPRVEGGPPAGRMRRPLARSGGPRRRRC